MDAMHCPLCGKVSETEGVCAECVAKVAGDRPPATAATGFGAVGWVIVTCLVGVILWAGVFSTTGKSAVKSRQRAAPDQTAKALTDCQYAIKGASINSRAARVPYVPDTGDSSMYAFSWSRSSGLELQNGFGAMLSSSASCWVDKRSMRIKLLTINGETIIGR